MTVKIGLWIDHRQALIVRLFETGQETSRVISHLPRRVRFSGVSEDHSALNPHNDTSQDRRDRRYDNLLNHYYDTVIEKLDGAASIFIMGPGEAKTELRKRLETVLPTALTVESADKMTDRQIIARIRQYFQENEPQRS
jgi:hypothetical protein